MLGTTNIALVPSKTAEIFNPPSIPQVVCESLTFSKIRPITKTDTDWDRRFNGVTTAAVEVYASAMSIVALEYKKYVVLLGTWLKSLVPIF